MERAEFAARFTENDPLARNVLADGIHLFGPPLMAKARAA